MAPTQKGLHNIIHPLISEITADCPQDLRPKWSQLKGVYEIPNGGILHPIGANNGHEDDARGAAAGLIVVDEAAYVDRLKYLVQDVLMPQTINTGGFVVLSSSSPRTPAHEFVGFIQEAKTNGSYSLFDIYESGYPPETIEEFKREAGGADSTTWRREYLCQLVVDSDFSIVPEWSREMVGELPRDDHFRFFHTYEAMDIGFKDFTAVLFGWYDFKRAKLFIEDEIIINGPKMTSDRLAEMIKAKEKALWGEKPVSRRVADNNNPIMLNDMAARHGIAFNATSKDSLEAMVNAVRVFVKDGHLVVHPRCVQTLGCLEFGVWDNDRRAFDRSDVYGHYDALAALVYLIRNLDVTTNPIPKNLGLSPFTHNIGFGDIAQTDMQAELEILKIFNMGNQRRF